MAIAPLRRRAGKIEIQNTERKIREELGARKQQREEPPSEEEHNKRVELLKSMGLLK